MTAISVESLVCNTDRLFLPSPCLLRSYAAGIELNFDRDALDAEKVLRKVFTAHFGPYSPQVVDWVTWCMDDNLPRHSDTRPKKRGNEAQFCDWLGEG